MGSIVRLLLVKLADESSPLTKEETWPVRLKRIPRSNIWNLMLKILLAARAQLHQKLWRVSQIRSGRVSALVSWLLHPTSFLILLDS